MLEKNTNNWNWEYKRTLNFILGVALLILLSDASHGAAKFAVVSGNWSGAIWAPTAAGIPGSTTTPTAADVVTINNGVAVSITNNVFASSIVVGVVGAGNAVLRFNTSSNVTLSVGNNLSVNDGIVSVSNSSGSRSYALVLGGSLSVLSGCSFDMLSADGTDICDVSFIRNGNVTISGTGYIDFNKINLALGSTSANVLDITSVITMTNGGLTLISGTFKLSSASVIVPFTTSASIPFLARLWNNGGIINSTNSIDWALAGTLQLSAGTINHGIAADDRIAPSIFGTGTVNISGGNLNCAGRISFGSNPWTYIMTGGTLTVGIVGNTLASYDPFNMDNAFACSFSMSGGTIIISRPGGTAGQSLGYHNTATLGTGFTGGTLQIGNAGTPAGSTISIDTSIPIYNLVIGSPNVTARLTTYNTTVTNDVSILSGAFSANSRNLNVGHNWTNNANFISTTATVTFNGASPQIIGGANATTFNSLRINNTNATLASSTIALSNDVSVTGLFTLTRGFMVTSSSDILSMTSTSSTTGTNANSYVNGPMTKTGTTAFIFPTGYGNGNKWARIGIGATSFSSTYSALYIALPFFNTSSMASLPTPILNNVSKKEFWQLDRTAGTGLVNVTLYWENASWSGINECSTADLRVARWAGSSWTNPNNAVTTTGTCAGAVSGTVKTVLDMAATGTLTFGSLSSGFNPLPIELIYFNAMPVNDIVNVNWTTAAEINNDFFEVQRSKNGTTFELLSKIKGAGNSSEVLNYAVTDNHPYGGISYYRLRQVDFDGKSTTSKSVAVNRKQQNNIISNVYPNPASDNLYIDLASTDVADIKIELTDATGRIVLEKHFKNNVEQQSLTLETAHIASGIYSLSIMDVNQGVVMQKKTIMLKN